MLGQALGLGLSQPPPAPTPIKPQVLEASLGPGRPDLGQAGLQAVLRSFRGLSGVMASFAAPGLGSGAAEALRGPRALHSCTPCMELSHGAHWEVGLPEAPPDMLSVALSRTEQGPWDPAFLSLSLTVLSFLSPSACYKRASGSAGGRC